jgi:hypothetical protein
MNFNLSAIFLVPAPVVPVMSLFFLFETSVAYPDHFDTDPDPTSGKKPDPDPALCKVL